MFRSLVTAAVLLGLAGAPAIAATASKPAPAITAPAKPTTKSTDKLAGKATLKPIKLAAASSKHSVKPMRVAKVHARIHRTSKHNEKGASATSAN